MRAGRSAMTSSPNHINGTAPDLDEPTNPSASSPGRDRRDPSAPQRVCLITTEFHGLFRNGGIGTANTGLALALAEAGFEVTVAFADADEKGPRVKEGNFEELQQSYRELGITLDFVPAYPQIARAF